MLREINQTQRENYCMTSPVHINLKRPNSSEWRGEWWLPRVGLGAWGDVGQEYSFSNSSWVSSRGLFIVW